MPELTTPTALSKAPTMLAGQATNGPNAANAGAADAAADDGTADRPSFAAALKGQVDKLAKQDAEVTAAATAAGDGIDALLPALEAGSLNQGGLPAFFSELMPLLARASAAPGEATTPAADLAAVAVVALPTPQVQADGLPAKVSGLAQTREATADATEAMVAADDAALDAQTAKLAMAAAKSADPGGAEVRAGIAGKGEFAEGLTRAGDVQSRGMAVATAGMTLDGAVHRPAAAPAEVRMAQPAGNEGWRNELGNTLTWMATAQRQQADLVLNPPQLGRVEVSLSISGDQASAVFASPNAAVREMLEDSLPRLREILAGAGINLGEAQVGSGSRDRSAEQSVAAERSAAIAQSATAAAQHEAAPQAIVRGGIGMVDVFA